MKKIFLVACLLSVLCTRSSLCNNLNMIHWGVSRIAFDAAEYLQQHRFSKIDTLRKDKELCKICSKKIGNYGYSSLLDSSGTILIHPDKKLEGKNVFELGHQTAFEIIKKSMPNKFSRGFYTWFSGEKYMCIVPVSSKPVQKKTFLLAYTVEVKHMDPSYKKNLEESIKHDDEIYSLAC